MIEIEKKFILRPGDEEKLVAGARYLKTVENIDTYFDTADFKLTMKDWWLRERSGRFEMKIPRGTAWTESRSLDQYQEIEHDEEICRALEFSGGPLSANEFERQGYLPFVTLRTTRRKYTRDNFTIDLDAMDFGYQLAEIERMAREGEEAEAAEEIMRFAERIGLQLIPVRGKVLEWAYRFKPELYQRWLAAWEDLS